MKNYKNDENLTLGNRIRELREKQGYSRKDFAEHIGIEYKSLSKIESGERHPNIFTLKAIALGLNLTIDYILTDEVLEGKEEYIMELNNCARRMPEYEIEHLLEYIKLFDKTRKKVTK